MTSLDQDTLSFTFPEIAWQVCTLVETHLAQILPGFLEPASRAGLMRALQEEWGFQHSAPSEQEVLMTKVCTLSTADIETALKEYVYSRAGLNDETLARCSVSFQRTLRIPDDGKTYPLPAGLGCFPLRSVDDFSDTVPEAWMKRGGVMMPMYQSEALWIRFSSRYPFAVKVAAGKINAISGEPWSSELQRNPQNYIVTPKQPWLDGFAVSEGVIRQFIAMPLGTGYSVEEQITGKADAGGIQIQVYPMRPESYFHTQVLRMIPQSLADLLPYLFNLPQEPFNGICPAPPLFGMGLGEGGRMHQEIYVDPYDFADWDQAQTSRCFVHLANSMIWRQITGANPPHPPLTAKEYKTAHIPWFDYYRDDLKPLEGSPILEKVKSVFHLGEDKNGQPFADDSSIMPEKIIQYGNARRPRDIREFLDEPS